MSNKNLEYNIYDTILTRLLQINGGANYNYALQKNQIYEEFKLADDIEQDVAICIGDVTLLTADPGKARDMWEIPLSIEIWGYVRHKTQAYKRLMKLLSDIRIAILGDEHLSNKAFEFTFACDLGVLGGVGILKFEVKCQYAHDNSLNS